MLRVENGIQDLHLCLECEETLCKQKPKSYAYPHIGSESNIEYTSYEEEEKLSSDLDEDYEGLEWTQSCLFCGDKYEKKLSVDRKHDKTKLNISHQVDTVLSCVENACSSSWSEIVFMCEPALLRHHVCQWLSVGEVVRLRLVCKWIGTLLRGHELDLEICPTTRRFLVSDIEQYFLTWPSSPTSIGSNCKAKYESDTDLELEDLTEEFMRYNEDTDNLSAAKSQSRARKRSRSGIVNTTNRSQWRLKGVKLECSDASSLQIFSTLTDTKLIKSLALSFSKPETASGFLHLHMFTNLENLNLSHSSQVTDRTLMSLSLCKNLKYLNLSYCENLQTIVPLGGCKNLLVLLLSGCRVLQHIRDLSSCVQLEELYLDRCQALTGEWLGTGLPNLRKLSMRGCRNLISLPMQLERCGKLEEIDLSGCTELSDVRVLGSPNLHYRLISLLNCESIQDVSFLAVHSSNLVWVSLGNCPRVQDIGPISGCSSLEFLDISGCSLAKVPSEINFISLKKLVMVGCCSLKDISALAKCDNLTELNLSGCINLNSVDALQSCNSLRTLHLALCTGLYSVSSLAKSKVLFHVDLRWCTRIVKKSGERLMSISVLID